MDPIIASASFDCVDQKGNAFETTVEIGTPVPYSTKHGSTNYKCYVAVLPLNVEREIGGVGTDSLMALTFAIENVRQILRVFVKLGGKVYFKGSKTPIDFDDRFGFTPVDTNLVRPEYRE